jgi:hypothetical protein
MPVPGELNLDKETYTKDEVATLVTEQNAALETNRNQLLAEAKAAKKALEAYKGVDPAKYRELEAAAAEAEQKRAEASGDWKTREQQLLAKHQQEVEARETKIQTLSGALERRLVDAEATSAIAEAKGSPKVLLPHIKAHVRVIEEDGEHVVRVVDAKGNPRIGDAGLKALRQNADAAARQPVLLGRGAAEGQRHQHPDPVRHRAAGRDPAVTYAANVDFSPTVATVTLDQWKEAPFQLSDNDIASVMNGHDPDAGHRGHQVARQRRRLVHPRQAHGDLRRGRHGGHHAVQRLAQHGDDGAQAPQPPARADETGAS